MKTKYLVYANVNPIRKNELVCIFNSYSFANNDLVACRQKACEIANDLSCKGYNVEVYCIETSVIDYTKFV